MKFDGHASRSVRVDVSSPKTPPEKFPLHLLFEISFAKRQRALTLSIVQRPSEVRYDCAALMQRVQDRTLNPCDGCARTVYVL
jgi:hypothetical protein